MSLATKIFHSILKDSNFLQEKIRNIFKKKEIKVESVELLKKKLIVKNQYKITVLINLKNSNFNQIVGEIHDNLYYFKRNIFSLEKFKGIVEGVQPASFFGLIEKEKIILREYLKGDFLSDLVVKKELDFSEIKNICERLALFLAGLHSLKIKNIPICLSKNLNKEIEKIILSKTLKFIKPNIEFLRKSIKENLKKLLNKMEILDKKNRICLIHGDYQIANVVLKNKNLFITDFDTVEMGNPGRDLGRFLFQMDFLIKDFYPSDKIKLLEEFFLKTYFENFKPNLFPDLETNINLHKAEMIQYIILGSIWKEKVPSPEKVVEIQKLLEIQKKFLEEKK